MPRSSSVSTEPERAAQGVTVMAAAVKATLAPRAGPTSSSTKSSVSPDAPPRNASPVAK